MNGKCCHDRTEEVYLSAFYCILREMICGMTNASLTDSISHNFIVQMIPHHRAAIQMSQNILKYTSDKELQRIATGIITEQTKSIEDMLAIEKSCGCFTNTYPKVQEYQRQMDCIMRTMFAQMQNACATERLNCDFMREMIPHHEGAVRMSETTLQYAICPELRPILRAIITSQKKGIRQMQNLLCRLGC
ncbi:MAG: DUF305 domain-containing protein [Butyrivibrio sp.]|nr:DUF305 domain-containing protein [Muribaculum sp.]MCM1552893.1 DUF305 domain-containing protein [Butyrivibrio sp.]